MLAEIEQLVTFLPRLCTEGFSPVQRWVDGALDERGVPGPPWPEYAPIVQEFFGLIGAPAWVDYGYSRQEAEWMLATEGYVENATLQQVRTMLTYCLRGERFSDGHWAAMIRDSHIRQLLERLRRLAEEMA